MNRLAVVTGATGGIGSALAEALCKKGFSVCLVGRNQEKLLSTQSALKARFGQCGIYSVRCDITDAEQRASLIDSVMALQEPLALWVNNAGINAFGLLENQSDCVIVDQLSVNAMAPILLTKALVNAVDPAKPLQIINIGSTFGTIGYAGFVAYSASKFALRGFSEALGRELADTAILVRYFAPRATRTSLNAPSVIAMNEALKVAMDDPADVARAFVKFVHTHGAVGYVGFPEKLFARLNSVLPSMVSGALRKQLRTIKAYAMKA